MNLVEEPSKYTFRYCVGLFFRLCLETFKTLIFLYNMSGLLFLLFKRCNFCREEIREFIDGKATDIENLDFMHNTVDCFENVCIGIFVFIFMLGPLNYPITNLVCLALIHLYMRNKK